MENTSEYHLKISFQSEYALPLITVIIPNYNHANFLHRRIESVLLQTWNDFDVIILDDCSTDDSKTIIEQYRNHPKVKAIVYNDVNSGSPFKQWAKGLTMATTEWVWIAESDDYCDIRFLETLITAFNDPSWVLAYNEIAWVDNNETQLKINNETIPKWWKQNDFLHNEMILTPPIVNASMAIFKTSAAKDIINQWYNYTYVGDYVFFCELAQRGAVYSSGKIMSYFRRHKNAASSNYDNSILVANEVLSYMSLLYTTNKISKKLLRKRIEKNLLYLLLPHSTFSAVPPGELYILNQRINHQFQLNIKIGVIRLKCGLIKLRHLIKRVFS